MSAIKVYSFVYKLSAASIYAQMHLKGTINHSMNEVVEPVEVAESPVPEEEVLLGRDYNMIADFVYEDVELIAKALGLLDADVTNKTIRAAIDQQLKKTRFDVAYLTSFVSNGKRRPVWITATNVVFQVSWANSYTRGSGATSVTPVVVKGTKTTVVTLEKYGASVMSPYVKYLYSMYQFTENAGTTIFNHAPHPGFDLTAYNGADVTSNDYLVLDGVDDYAQILSRRLCAMGTSDFVLLARLYVNSSQPAAPYTFVGARDNVQRGWMVGHNNIAITTTAHVSVFIKNADNSLSVNLPKAPTDAWFSVMLSVDRTNDTLRGSYIKADGTLVTGTADLTGFGAIGDDMINGFQYFGVAPSSAPVVQMRCSQLHVLREIAFDNGQFRTWHDVFEGTE